MTVLSNIRMTKLRPTFANFCNFNVLYLEIKDTNVFGIQVLKQTFLVFKNKTYTYYNNVQNEGKRKARLST